MNTKPIPWRRFWARNFDYLLHAVVIVILWALIAPNSLMAINNSLLGFLLMLLWLILECIYMAYFGTTLGKKIMGITVRTSDGTRVSGFIAVKRSRIVWVRGMGLGVGIIQLIANLVGYSKLRKDGITSWDRELALVVSHEKIGFLRYLICPVIVLAVIGLAIMGIVLGE
jgi:hypothetical protein